MYPMKDIIDKAVNSKDHSTLVAALTKQISEGRGEAALKTASGRTLTAKSSGGKVTITGENGGSATVTTANVAQSNGVIHVVDKVLLPK